MDEPKTPDIVPSRALPDVEQERLRQDLKWGQQNHPDGRAGPYCERAEAEAKQECEEHAAAGTLTWMHILEEEVAEVDACYTAERLRAELVQVAAVAVAWIECIDRRAASGEDTFLRKES